MMSMLWIVLGLAGLASGLVSVLLLWDKRQARLGRWRVPEVRLHVLELLGGWPASWAVRLVIRHKTVKVKYRVWFGLAVAGHVAAVVGVLWLVREVMASS
ncbi:MAG: DUF1294 domain-containing protein [Planctomycetota bacterium]